jgi:bacteriorhodopsin
MTSEKYFQVIWKFGTTSVTRVHGDMATKLWLYIDLLAFKFEFIFSVRLRIGFQLNKSGSD